MKLKKNIAIVFTCYYLIICVGLTLTVHFCGGSLAGVSAVSSEVACEMKITQDACCASKTATKPDCCNDTVVDLSEVDEDSLFHETTIEKQFVAVLPNVIYSFFKNTKFQNKVALPNYTFQSNAPPLYKLYGTYIHYA